MRKKDEPSCCESDYPINSPRKFMSLSVLYTESAFLQEVTALVEGFVFVTEVHPPELGKAALLALFIQILAQKIYDALPTIKSRWSHMKDYDNDF